MSATRIILFAKAPLPGQVKTRLIPALGASGAAMLARRMLMQTLDAAVAARVGIVELCASPGFQHADWSGFNLPEGVVTSEQRDGDIGQRMACAARRALADGERVLLIGSDCPALSAQRLRIAALALDEHDAVIHPALDGGYPLLGLKVFAAELFDSMPWSTSQVAALTLARMQALRWRTWVGETLPDIDEIGDLIHLPETLR